MAGRGSVARQMIGGVIPALLAIVVAAHFAVATPAFAEEPAPHWEVGEICASSSLGAQCPRIESQNRSSLLLRWAAIPDEDRKACKALIEHSGKPSYKLLLNCVEERQLKALDLGPQAAPHKANES